MTDKNLELLKYVKGTESTALLMQALAGPIAEHVQRVTQPLLDRIRKLENRASELEAKLSPQR